MFRCATVTTSFAMLAVALLASGRAEAGASASAPSKYSNASQVATVHHARTNRQVRNPGLCDYGIFLVVGEESAAGPRISLVRSAPRSVRMVID